MRFRSMYKIFGPSSSGSSARRLILGSGMSSGLSGVKVVGAPTGPKTGFSGTNGGGPTGVIWQATFFLLLIAVGAGWAAPRVSRGAEVSPSSESPTCDFVAWPVAAPGARAGRAAARFGAAQPQNPDLSPREWRIWLDALPLPRIMDSHGLRWPISVPMAVARCALCR